MASKPTARVRFSSNYKWADTENASVTLKFNIMAATNSWVNEPAISGWTFGQTASTPTGEAKYGTVKVEYKKATEENSAYTTTVPTNAGAYKVRFTVDATTSYGALEKVLDLTIAKATPSYNVPTNLTATYGQTLADVSLPTGFAWQDANSTSVGNAGNNKFNVTYTLSDTNYNEVKDIEVTIAVAKATVKKPDADTTAFTYNGSEHTYTVAESDLYTVDGNKKTNAGEHTVTVALADKANYTWADGTTEDATYSFVIAKANASITVDTTPIEKTYGEDWELPVATSTFGTPVADKTIDDMVNAGTYTITYSVAGTDNYNGDTESVSVTINPVKVTKPDADTTEFVYNGSEQTYAVEENDNYTVSGNKRTDAGEQVVTVSLDDKSNYTWADGTTEDLTFTFVIAKANALITVDTTPIEKTYGEDWELPDATSTFGTPVADKTIDDMVNAGIYTITYSVAGTDNYNGDTESVSVTINPVKVTKPAADTTAFTYNGSEQTYAVEENDNYTVSGNKRTDAGEQVITVSLDDKSNYTWADGTTEDLTFTFNIATLDITNAVITLGDALTYNGSEQTQTIASVKVDGLDVTYTVTDDKATNYNADGYELTVTANGNFSGTKTASWSIAKATPAPNADKITTARVRRGQKLADATVTNGEFFAVDGTTVLEGTFAWVDNTKEITADSTEKMKFTPVDTNYAEIEIDVAVDSYTTGGGGGSSNTTTTTTKNDDGSTTKTTTNKATGTTTEVTTNTDGSTTTVETKKDGTVTTTEKDKDGNTTTTVENPDGSSTTTEKNKDGSETVVEKDTDGTTTTTEKDSEGNKTVTTEKADGSTTTEETKKDGTKVTTETNADGETTAEVETKGETEVVIPAPNAEDVTKVVVTDKDGNETEVEFEVKDGGIAISVSGNSTVSVQTGHTCYAKDFTDVDLEAWYHLNVDYVLENGLFKGTTETTFAPNANLTRAMLVTVLYRAEGEPATNRSIPFADVDMGSYYANAVIWAQQNGIVKGVSETEFAPNDNITREQIAAILYRYAIYKGMDAVNLSENLSFTDADEISEYAISALNWAVGTGLIKGYEDNTVRPLNNATRAEAAALLQRFIVAN